MNSFSLDIPPIVEIDEEMVESSEMLKPDDVGSWGVVVSNGDIILCSSQDDAESILEIICNN